MAFAFALGDKVATSSSPHVVAKDYVNMTGEVTELLEDGRIRVKLDQKESPVSNPDGWIFKATALSLAGDPSADEIADLFGIGPKVPGQDSTLIELLEHIDNGLRNGTKMTRANLAFEYLLKHLELSRLDLPTYVFDMQENR